MNEKILESILLRPNMKNVSKELLTDMLEDAVHDVKNFINYKEDEDLPKSLAGIVKKIVVANVNRIGFEGMTSSGFSGVSTSYTDILSKDDIKKLKKHRRIPTFGSN